MTIKTVWYVLFSLCLVAAQSLFESAGRESPNQAGKSGREKAVDLSGYVRGAFFGGQNYGKEAEVKAAYAEVSLKLDARKSDIGKAFTEVRLKPGIEHGSMIFLPDIREAWVSTSPGPIDITLGKKIIAWGRADGINPTNTVTPMNATALSSEYDDTRLGNLLARASVSWNFFSVEGIWLPLFTPDILPIEGADLPPEVTITGPLYPGPELENSGFALRCDLSFPVIDGSFSYFNGFETQPGFDHAFGLDHVALTPTAYRVHTAGVDFSTAIGPFGLRGEASLTVPFDDPDDVGYVPFRHAAYVLGLDRSISDWNFLAQYSGVYVIGFHATPEPVLSDPSNLLAQQVFMLAKGEAEMQRINRLFAGTDDRASHAVTARIGWRGLHETLRLELAGLYNFTTEEYAVNPVIAYDIADALCVTVGGRYLRGPEGSLNDLIDDLLSYGYAELRLSF
ncbi:MAG: hypothetical protein JXA18_00655 [Chitinispirillaceae bacterium]|nr:hypothetical protein [Chitinispirillaceae bacterium]